MTGTSLVGMNLAGNTYYSTQFPFIDRMKSAGSWMALGVDGSLIKVDKNGYPTGIPAGADHIYTMVGMDTASAGTSKVYVLTYTGKANFEMLGGRVLSREPGKITFEYVSDSNMMPLKVSGLDAGSPLSALHIVRGDQQELFAAGEIFNPALIEKLGLFDTLRYMDWINTNATTVKDWSDRTETTDLSWSANQGSMPIEVMVALANQTMTNMWLNVPTMATDDYVRQMMGYVRDNLDPSLSVSLEYSNEVWNWGFQQSQYAHQEAAKLWGKDANGDGVVNPTDPAEQLGSGWVEFYGYRAAQIANIANQIFGDDAGRVNNVLGTQTGYLGIENYIFAGVARANLGTASALFDDYAVTTSFGGNFSNGDDVDRKTVLAWARSGDAGMAAAFAALKDGTGLSGGGSLAGSRSLYAYQAAVAAKHGLDLVAYEGGVDLLASGYGSHADQQEALAFFKRLQADPRMGELYKQMVDDFGAAGGELANAFIDAHPDSGQNMYGSLKSIYDTGSPAWDALVAAQKVAEASAPPAPVPPVPAPDIPVAGPDIPPVLPGDPAPDAPEVPPMSLPTGLTDEESYAMADGERAVAYVGSDAFTAVGNALDNTIFAGDAGSSLRGEAGSDVLIGGAGADRLDGGVGIDTLIGGDGDDVYVVENAGDVVVEKANGGADEVRTTLTAYTLDADIENLTYTGAAAFTGTGNAAANVLTGGDGGARLSGGAGDDRLNGGGGADLLDGGIGDDVAAGGAGDDVYVVDSAGDRVIEAVGGGMDEVRTALASHTLSDHVEKLAYTGAGAFSGTGNDQANAIIGGAGSDRIFGRGGDDRIEGGAGDDLLDGGVGDDVMTGGLGDDVYVVDSTADRIVESAGQGTDEVRTTAAAYTLSDDLEKLTHTGTGAFTGTGNKSDNVLTGGSGANRLLGGEGADLLNGGGGGDHLDGGAGVDRMVGGGGDDVYVVDGHRDAVIEERGGGTDEIRTTLSTFVLSGEVENLTFVGTGGFQGMGNALDNILVGGSGQNRLLGGAGKDQLIGGDLADTLDGGMGADRMAGGGGNDVYFVDGADDVVVEVGNAGLDTVYSTASYTLSANVENLLLSGGRAIDGTGNDLANKLVGNGGANRLIGGGGNDNLVGGGGNDLLEGGDGDDTMVGDDGEDTLRGGASNDVLVGGAGDDVLVGGAGADMLTGNAGADRFVFGPGDLEADPSKTDRILDFSRLENDKIDVSAFDANSRTGELDAFSFIGSAAFSNRAGELRIDTSGTYQVVSGDLNGDGIADFTINVSKGAGALIAADFLL